MKLLPLPELASTEAARIDEIFYWATGLTAVAFAAVLVLLVTFSIRYRARGRATGVHERGERPRDFALTFGLAVLVFVAIDLHLAVRDHFAYAALFEGNAGAPYRVEVLAKRFEWLFRYPGGDGAFGTDDDVTTRGRLVVPVGRTVEVAITSRDVLHSFFVPAARVKMDAVPGRATRIRFRLDKPGVYEIACAELCGMAHYTMRGFVEAVEEAESRLSEIGRTGEGEKWGWDWDAGPPRGGAP